MKNLVLASLLLAGTAGLAHADSDDHPGPGWMSLAQVNHALRGMGFRGVSKIEADDGLWEAHARRNGLFYEVKLDPYSGRIVESSLNDEDDD